MKGLLTAPLRGGVYEVGDLADVAAKLRRAGWHVGYVDLADARKAVAGLGKELRFPDWYGGNLDALFDCLTDLREDTVICLENPDGLERRLGAFGGRALRVLREAAEENPHLHLTMEKET